MISTATLCLSLATAFATDPAVAAPPRLAGFRAILPGGELFVPAQIRMADERFAGDAVAGRKRMVISHCQLQPDGYASTAETADYLLRELGLKRRTVHEAWGEQWQCESRCERGSLSVLGFSGTTGADHMRHLRNIGRLWEVASR